MATPFRHRLYHPPLPPRLPFPPLLHPTTPQIHPHGHRRCLRCRRHHRDHRQSRCHRLPYHHVHFQSPRTHRHCRKRSTCLLRVLHRWHRQVYPSCLLLCHPPPSVLLSNDRCFLHCKTSPRMLPPTPRIPCQVDHTWKCRSHVWPLLPPLARCYACSLPAFSETASVHVAISHLGNRANRPTRPFTLRSGKQYRSVAVVNPQEGVKRKLYPSLCLPTPLPRVKRDCPWPLRRQLRAHRPKS
jgi:hypothetical protein